MPRPTATVSVVGKGDVKASVAVNINGDEVVNSTLPPMQQPASAVITVVGDGDVHASVHVELDGGDVSVQTTEDVNIGQEERLRDVTPAVPQMDLESISKEDLMKICGIGPVLSQRLIVPEQKRALIRSGQKISGVKSRTAVAEATHIKNWMLRTQAWCCRRT